MQRSEAEIRTFLNALLDLTENIIGFLKKNADISNELSVLYGQREKLLSEFEQYKASVFCLSSETISEWKFTVALLQERDAEAMRLFREKIEFLRAELITFGQKKSLLLYS